MDGRSEAGKDHAARGGAAKLFDARDDVALGAGEAGTLDIGGVGEEGEDAVVAIAGEGVEVEGSAPDWSLVNLEVAGVNNHSEGSAHGERDAIDRAVRNGNEFDFEGTNFDEASAWDDFTECRGLEESGFVKAFLN